MLTIPKCPNCGNDMAAMAFPWDGKGEIEVSHWTCPKCGWVKAPKGTTVEFDLNGGRSPVATQVFFLEGLLQEAVAQLEYWGAEKDIASRFFDYVKGDRGALERFEARRQPKTEDAI